jgi:methyl-accepting chemotaxis protein
MTIAAEIGVFILSNENSRQNGLAVVTIAEKIFNEEIIYLTDCLLEAEENLEGDATFEKVFFYDKFEGYNYRLVEDIIENANTKHVVITPYVTNEKGEQVTLVALKRLDGIIIGELSKDYFDTVLSVLKSNETDTSFIANVDGEIILSANYDVDAKNNSLSENFGLSIVAENLKQKKSSVFKTKIGDEKATISQTGISEYGYSIIYATYVNTIYSQAVTIGVILIVIVVILFFLAWWVGQLIAKQIAAPIVATTDRLVKVVEGDLHGETPVTNRGDETQILNEAMVDTIKEFSAYIKDIERFLSAISDGNLNVTSDLQYHGDYGKIREALTKIRDNLKTTISGIKEASEQVASGSNALSCSAQLLAENTSQEAATLEEISSMTIDIETNVGKNANATIEASNLLKDIVATVETGSQKMTEMKESMEEIQRSSEEIEKIVKMIDDIAFQTNILSLNAAVEAARAGAAGKGFSVVADEVRNLATKSAEAAQNTMQLVEKSSKAVKLGSALTNETNESLEVIHSSIGQFAGLMDNITEASKEQESAIKQITLGIEQLSNAVQSNSATAEESASSTNELNSLAETLKDEVEHFNV